MASHQVLEQRGLMASDNELTLPKGALVEGTNVIIRNRGVIEPKRGMKFVGQSLGSPAAHTFGASNARSTAGAFFGTTLVHQYGAVLQSYDGSSFADYTGTFIGPDTAQQRMKFVEFAQSLVLTTSAGPYILDAAAGTPELMGVPRAWDCKRTEVSLSGNPGDGWMSTDCKVAYRVVWGKKDANGRLKLGAPSGRVTIHNPANIIAAIGTITIVGTGMVFVDTATEHGFEADDTFTVSPGEAGITAGTETVDSASGVTDSRFYWNAGGAPPAGSNTVEQTLSSGLKNVALRVRIPTGITTSYFFQVYRSFESPTMNTEPDDELYLVHEAAIAAGDVTAGYVDIVDKTPESLLNLGTPLYTNANTGDGIEAANFRPPLCRDLFSWDGRLFAVNTTERHRFELQLLGVGSPDGAQNDDTVTIATRTYTFKNSPGAATDVQLHSISTPEENIERTAQNLVEVINADAGNTWVFAYYVSAHDDVPGKVLIEQREFSSGLGQFTVYASRIASWHPWLTTGSTGAQTSNNNRRKNGISYSKQGEPDSWPLGNYLPDIGSPNWETLRGLPLGDKAYVFTQGPKDVGGIWTLYGQAPYVAKQIDQSAQLVAPDTAIIHDNQIFALTTQGFVAISDGGVRIVSKPIEDELIKAIAQLGTTLKRYAFAVSYESERLIELWLPASTSDTSCKVCHVYNSLTDTWTKYSGDRTWGVVNPSTNVLYEGAGDKNSIRIERKDVLRTDYADESVAVTINTGGSASVVLADATDVAIGDILYQSATKIALVTGKTSNTLAITTPTAAFTSGSAQVEKAFTSTVRYAAAAPGGPDLLKHFRDLTLHFRRFFAKLLTATFTSEIGTTEKTRPCARSDYTTAAVTLAPVTSEAGPRNVPVEVPIEQAECTQLRVGITIREAWGVWALNGHTLTHDAISDTKGAR